MLMAERHRLFGALPLLGYPWRTLQLIEGDSQGDDNQPCQDQARAGQRVSTPVKNLRHWMSPCFLGFRGVKRKARLRLFAIRSKRMTVEVTSPHRAWRVEYSSKPEGVGNSRTGRPGFMTAAKESL